MGKRESEKPNLRRKKRASNEQTQQNANKMPKTITNSQMDTSIANRFHVINN